MSRPGSTQRRGSEGRRRGWHTHVCQRGGDLGDRGGHVGVGGVVLVPPGRARLVRLAAVDLDKASLEKADHDHARLEDREPAVVGEVGDRAVAVHLAQQRPVVRAEDHVRRGRRSGRQDGDGVCTADEGHDGGPLLVTTTGRTEKLGDLHGRGDVLAGPLAVAELLLRNLPVQEVGDLVADLLAHEGLDHGTVDEAEMHEELAEAPALELGALHLQRLCQCFRSEDAGGHEADAEQRTAARDRDRVDVAVPEPHCRLLALGLGHDEAAGGLLGGQLEQEAVHAGREAAVRHA